MFELEVGMSSHSGIRASNSGSSEFAKKIVLKDAASYGPRKAKITSILDVEDVWEIVNGAEAEPAELPEVDDGADDEVAENNNAAVVVRQAEIKALKKREKKAASLITQTVDDTIVMSLECSISA